MSAQIFRLHSDPLPDILYLDASLLLNAFGESDKQSPIHMTGPALRFLVRVREEALKVKLIPLVSVHTLQEAFFILLRDALIENDVPESGIDDWHTLFKQSPALIQNHLPLLDNFMKRIYTIGAQFISPELLFDEQGVEPSLEEEMKRIVETYNVLPADALHVALAKRAGAEGIATTDFDFERVADEIPIYVRP